VLLNDAETGCHGAQSSLRRLATLFKDNRHDLVLLVDCDPFLSRSGFTYTVYYRGQRVWTMRTHTYTKARCRHLHEELMMDAVAKQKVTKRYRGGRLPKKRLSIRIWNPCLMNNGA